MKRREFIGLLGGAAGMWPLGARSQQPERMRRIGVVMNLAADDLESQRRKRAFVEGLQQLGWTEGRNIRIDTRWGAGDADRFRQHAAELVELAPDVILVASSAVMGMTRRRPVSCLLCSCRLLIQLPVSSGAWRGLAATPPVSCSSNTELAENGWNCLRKLRPT